MARCRACGTWPAAAALSMLTLLAGLPIAGGAWPAVRGFSALPDTPERQALLAAGEASLAGGDTDSALQAFERAAALRHAADAEMALVRTHMQAGEYRRALGFAPHAAAAHRESPAAAVLYAWLLYVGGQGAVARTTIEQALRATPDDAALQRAQAGLGPLLPDTSAETPGSGPPLRLRPYAAPAALIPAAAVAVGSGVLIGAGGDGGDGGVGSGDGIASTSTNTSTRDGAAAQALPASAQHAVVPARALAGARGVWVRNGMGQAARAAVVRIDDESGLALLRLASALPQLPGLQRSARDPFAGSPATMVGYSPAAGAEPAWPLLRSGFFGRTRAAASASAAPAASAASAAPVRDLNIDAAPGEHGGPVFDAGGRLAGLALPGDDGAGRMFSCDTLASRLGAPLPPPAVAVAPIQAEQRAALDGVYEQALRLALQVLVLR